MPNLILTRWVAKSGFFPPKTIKGLSRKLMHSWHGPYRLVHKLTPVTFELRTQTNKLLKAPVHVNRMKPFGDPTDRPVGEPELPPDNQDVSSTFRKMKSLMTVLNPQNYQQPLPVLPSQSSTQAPFQCNRPTPLQ